MKNKLIDIYDSLQEIAWHFGSHGINGECCDDLSFVEFMALKKVQNQSDYSIQELGNALNFSKSGATRIVDRLESKGYVSRKNSPVDGRICCVTSTKKGETAIRKILDNYIVYLEEIFKAYEPEKINTLQNALNTLVDAIQKSDVKCDENSEKGGACR
jgi:DNA-binding MarR family transcriptional regulator